MTPRVIALQPVPGVRCHWIEIRQTAPDDYEFSYVVSGYGLRAITAAEAIAAMQLMEVR